MVNPQDSLKKMEVDGELITWLEMAKAVNCLLCTPEERDQITCTHKEVQGQQHIGILEPACQRQADMESLLTGEQ